MKGKWVTTRSPLGPVPILDGTARKHLLTIPRWLYKVNRARKFEAQSDCFVMAGYTMIIAWCSGACVFVVFKLCMGFTMA